jgi:16S rRNA (uracil1498-N3)-methyltransferase
VNLFYQPLLEEGILYLDEEESRHCIKVLRKQSGDQIKITDGKGFFYVASISKADPRQCAFEIREKVEEKEKPFSIHVAIAPTKNSDRIEWFVEKTVEIGIDTITLLNCKNSERSFIKIDRLKKVAISAMKQSVKSRLPTIQEMTPFASVVSSSTAQEKFIAFVDFDNELHLKAIAQKQKTYIVLIGPEGDFTTEELSVANSSGFKKISLGKSRLRTETAGMVACHTLNLINT